MTSCDAIAEELRAALDVYRAGKPARSPVTVLYELSDGDGFRSYHTRIAGDESRFAEGALDYAECDVVIRTTPEALHRILAGELAGREAVMSGALDIRKVPSMQKLMVLRALFSRYTKARRRQASGDCVVAGEAPADGAGGLAAR